MLELRRVSLGADEETTTEATTTPLLVQSGYVAVPTSQLQSYVRSQFITFAGGFVVGMGMGALFGNFMSKGRR